LDIGITRGAYPFAKTHGKGERPTRSVVRTFSLTAASLDSLLSIMNLFDIGAVWKIPMALYV
jgi:hypothetical protein